MDDIKGRKKTEIKVRNVPIELKNHFLAYCAKRGTSMSAVLRKFMIRSVADDVN